MQDLKGGSIRPKTLSSSSSKDLQNLMGGVSETARMEYGSVQEYASIARQFGLMDDVREGTPRSAYNGIVQFVWDSKTTKIRVFIAPQKNLLVSIDTFFLNKQ